MKHRLVVPAILAAAALSLTACAPDPIVDPSSSLQAQPSSEPLPNAADVRNVDEALAEIDWQDNGEGAEPTITVDAPINFDKPGTLIVEDGDGEAIEDGQMLSLHYVAISGVDGAPVHSTYAANSPEPVEMSSDSFEPTLYDALSKSKVGVRLLYAVPDNGGGSVVMAVTVVAAVHVPDRAEGTAVEPTPGDPTVSLDGDGKPSIDFSGATMPTELVSRDLIVGDGPALTEEQTVTVKYTGWLWDGEQFDSSWDRGQDFTTVLSKANLIHGWIDGLVGKPVGSQVMLVIPPELGYGDQDNGTIPAGSTLVFVIDILAAY